MKGRCQGRAFFLLLLAAAALDSAATPFQLVSVRDPSQEAPAGGNGDSYAPILTPDGRYILFASAANNLTDNGSSNAVPSLSIPAHLNVFLRDRTNGISTLVSINLNGAGGNGNSLPMGISTNGRYAVFESAASDLVPADTNGVSDIFVRDLVGGTTTLVSVGTNGGPADGLSRSATMSADGRFVAFVSAGDNLVLNDTNGIADIFLRDRQVGTTTLVSVGATTTNSSAAVLQSSSESPEISSDGRYVAFCSSATNLVPGVATAGEIYLRDTAAGATVWASTNARAIASTLFGISNVVSYDHALSADGKFLAFETSINPATVSYTSGLVLRFNLDTGLTDVVSTNAAVPYSSEPEDIHNLDVSADGRFVTFVANNGTNNFAVTTSIYLWDSQTGSNTLVSINTNDIVSTNATCNWPSVDASGRYVAFLSSATNLVTNSLSGLYQYHLYLRDVLAGITTLLDKDTNGIGSSVAPSTAPRINANGSVVAFEAPDASMVANDRNHDSDVFLRDLVTQRLELISAHHPTLGSSTANGLSAGSTFSLSTDGRFVAFASDADNLVANDTNGLRDIFVRDLFTGKTLLASVGPTTNAANAPSFEPSVSGNGRFVAFTTAAANLTLSDTNRARDVFVRDLQTGSTVLISVNTNGISSGNGASFSPVISTDGRYVLFRSYATNLAPGHYSSSPNLFLRDTQLAVTYSLTHSGVAAAAMTPDGRYVAFSPSSVNPNWTLYLWDSQFGGLVFTNAVTNLATIGVSPDGNRIVYVSSSGSLSAIERAPAATWLIANQVSGGPNVSLRFSADGQFLVYKGSAGYASSQIFVYDFGLRTGKLVSRSFNGLSGGNGNSDSPDINADARFIAYRSVAGNLTVSTNTLGVPQLFLYDRGFDTTTLLTSSRFIGGLADNRSMTPCFSGDGHLLAFQTWASDLVQLDYNHGGDVLTLSFLYATITPSSNPLQGPTLTWPARPGETYQVQTNGTWGSGPWQNAAGTITIMGNQAQFTDPTPGIGQRFYRIVAF